MVGESSRKWMDLAIDRSIDPHGVCNTLSTNEFANGTIYLGSICYHRVEEYDIVASENAVKKSFVLIKHPSVLKGCSMCAVI